MDRVINRRTFLCRGSLVLAGAALGYESLLAADAKPQLRIGLVTDLHYADREPVGSRHYRETLAKFEEAAKRFEQEKTDLVIELGDMIDAADSVEAGEGLPEADRQGVRRPAGSAPLRSRQPLRLEPDEARVPGDRQPEDRRTTPSTWAAITSSFSTPVSAATARRMVGRTTTGRTPTFPAAEIEWLRVGPEADRKKALVFVHQCLDVAPPYGIKNATDVRKVLEEIAARCSPSSKAITTRAATGRSAAFTTARCRQ